MIQEAETLIKYGYLAMDLPHQSGKSILAKCDGCGKVRKLPKCDYRTLCNSCVKKDRIFTEDWKANLSAAEKGEKNHNFGKCGAESLSYKGGKKASHARAHAKRRQLGLIPLNTYFEGCEGHHITHTFVLYIPKWLHQSVYHNLNTCQGMEAINALALNFLVNGV